MLRSMYGPTLTPAPPTAGEHAASYGASGAPIPLVKSEAVEADVGDAEPENGEAVQGDASGAAGSA